MWGMSQFPERISVAQNTCCGIGLRMGIVSSSFFLDHLDVPVHAKERED